MEERVEIYDISYEGAGVGRADGKIVFVPKTLIGEDVEIEKVKETSSFVVAEAKKIVKKSVKRIIPECPYFEKCGGCDFQHCDYSTEVEIKTNILKNQLKKTGFLNEIEFQNAPDRFGYRNKIKLMVSNGKLGYRKSKSSEFVEIKNCAIASNKINEAIESVRGFLKKNSFKGLKSVYIKLVDEDCGICFLFDKNYEKSQKNIKNIENLSGFSVFFAFGDVLEDNSTKVYHLSGKTKLSKKLDDIEMMLSISAFNQVNEQVAKMLYEFVVENCKGERVVNAYSGQGLLTYLIAKNARIVYGIEYQISAHESAERLASLCPEYRIENICGKVEDCLGGVLLRDRIDSLVLDPAREGCKKTVLDAILDSKIEKIVYVSCNFATLTRDLGVLQEKYEIKRVKVFDMFSCCSNMETVVILERK